MKKLIKNYIDLLSVNKLKEFAFSNNINLTDNELNYILNLIKNNYDDILINESIYLDNIKANINPIEYEKLKNLYFYYKNRYKGYLF